jgi:hypothetical protein
MPVIWLFGRTPLGREHRKKRRASAPSALSP